MRIGIVLHAHLPWVRHPEPFSAEERWFHDALLTTYLPLLALGREHPGLTLSISPPLAAMLADRTLHARFEAHLDALVALNETVRYPARAHYALALAEARTAWLAVRGDILGALTRAPFELWTSAVTHAYLPGLVPVGGAVRVQLELGRRLFANLAVAPRGRWLPECAIDAAVERELEATATTVVDAHAIGTHEPHRGPGGAALLARHREASHRVWSRDHGYPRHPVYREFFRDLGHGGGPLGPFRRGEMTGLKYWRITGPGPHKELYEPEQARAQAERDAEDFVGWLEGLAAREEVLTTAYDAELFGHWWHEGPWFLAATLARIADSPKLSLVPATEIGSLARRSVVPASSSWGRGGDHRVWIGPATAPLWRHVHATHRMIRETVNRHEAVVGRRGLALDQAIVELLQLEASDWPFALEGTPAAGYAARRFALHHRRAWRLAAIASGGAPNRDETAYLERSCDEAGFLHQLDGPALREPFLDATRA